MIKELLCRSKYVIKIALATILCGCLIGCEADKKIVLTTGFQENEIFRIDSTSCYSKELLLYLVNTENQYKELYGEQFLSSSQNGIDVKDNISEAVLSKLTRVKIMNLMAEKYHIDLDDTDLELINKAANEYYASLNEKEKELFSIESVNDIATIYKEYRIAEKIYEFLVKDIDPEISDDEARTMVVKEIFFDKRGMNEEEKQKLRLEAEDVLERIADGEDFESLAANYSDKEQIHCSYTKMSIDQDIAAEAFELSKGELSKVIDGADGFYILYCEDPFNRDETDATKEEIVKNRKLQAFENTYNKYADDRKYYFNEDLWSEIVAADITNTTSGGLFEIYYKYFK